jgi:hypothetical protein
MSVSRVVRVSLVALAVVVTTAPSVVSATSGTPTYEGPGAASPEGAVTTYMDGLAVRGVLTATSQLQPMGVYMTTRSPEHPSVGA